VSEAAVVARGVGKQYSASGWALREVDLDVKRGEVFGIVGENGSGKSTLLDLVMGVARPSEGALAVSGPVASIVELGAGFFPELSGEQNALLASLVAGLRRPEAERRTRAVADFAELGDHFHQPLSTYSAGMAMRLGFAVAASLEAPLTVIDEVLAVGDGYFQRKCIDRILALRRQGATLVIASHDLHALTSLCDRVLWLRLGRVEALGDARQVVGSYDEHLRRRANANAAAPGRHGTGEIVIREVRLLDGSGRPAAQLATGATLRVDVLFEAREPIQSPTMGVAIFRDDGVYCSGPNTGFDGVLEGVYEGRYRLSAEFPELPLLGGRYEVSISFYDKDHVYAYAWDHRLYPFEVISSKRDHGLVALRHSFTVERA
jgi:ABC-type polysaccharide/polyol phosphate transport system ATPase subunit